MPWTFTADPINVPLDAVRILVGDDDPSEPQIDDAIIEWRLALTPTSVLRSAIDVADLMITRFARQVNNSIDGLSVSASELVEHYRDVKERLTVMGAGEIDLDLLTPVCISKAKTDAAMQDPDRPKPLFTLDQFQDRESLPWG